MKTIAAQTFNGAITPAEPILVDALAVQFDGTHYVVYEPGDTLPPVPTPDLLSEVVDAVQDRLDAFARTRNYDGVLSACTYASSTVAQFAKEGTYCVSARDATWQKCYDILSAVKSGTQPMPASVDAVLAQLPAMAWPA